MRLDFYSYHHIVMLPIPEKRPSMLKMSQDFITNLLKSIRKSEATTIEKQRRIQDFLETNENACLNLK